MLVRARGMAIAGLMGLRDLVDGKHEPPKATRRRIVSVELPRDLKRAAVR